MLLVAVYLGVVVVHELVHGLFFRLFGGRPRYGAGFKYFMPYFSAASPGDEFSLGRMIAIGLAPLRTISAAALLGALVVPSLGAYFSVAFIGNAAGAVGDIWMTSRLAKFLPTRDATVVDLADGMAVYSANPRALEIAATVRRSDERPAGFVVHWIGATLVVLVVEGLAGVIGPFFGDSVLIGPAQLPLMTFEKSAEAISWTFNVASPLVAGLVFAVAAQVFSRRLRRDV